MFTIYFGCLSNTGASDRNIFSTDWRVKIVRIEEKKAENDIKHKHSPVKTRSELQGKKKRKEKEEKAIR